MKKKIFLVLCICSVMVTDLSSIEVINVPSRIKFAGMTLIITSAAKELIIKKIETLVGDEKAFKRLVDRVNLFMPIVEKILQEENVPNDFKYVPIQESAMISDADRLSASLGFWQFELLASKDVNLRTDHLIDERMHIVESTRGAARYLKSHNEYFNNWVCTLLAYNRGREWVRKNGYKKYFGETRMIIDGNTHWYVIHFLAHKLVFEHRINKVKHPNLYLHEHKNAHGESIDSIAKMYNIEERQLRDYNKWMKNTHIIPTEKNYSIIVPLSHYQKIPSNFRSVPTFFSSKLDHNNYVNTARKYPYISPLEANSASHIKKNVNGLSGIIAREGDTIASLSKIGNISEKDFIEYNDIDKGHTILVGQPYYFESKRRSADVHLHITEENETWHSVSQKYAIRKKSLLIKNREISDSVNLEKGRVLWMRFIRPARVPIAYRLDVDKKSKE